MDEIKLLKEIVDLKESLEWFNGELGRSRNYVSQLRGQTEQQQGRILELEVRLANADMARRHLRQENLRLEEELLALRSASMAAKATDTPTGVGLEAALEELVDGAQDLLEKANNCWQHQRRRERRQG